jgi:hypothetical protein
MDKPWGPGSATELCEALGDWDGDKSKKTVQSRGNSLGRYLKKVQPFLKGKGIMLEIVKGKQPYLIYQETPAKAEAPAIPNTPKPVVDISEWPTFPSALAQME